MYRRMLARISAGRASKTGEVFGDMACLAVGSLVVMIYFHFRGRATVDEVQDQWALWHRRLCLSGDGGVRLLSKIDFFMGSHGMLKSEMLGFQGDVLDLG